MFQHPVKMLRVKDECLSCSIGEIRMPDDFLLKQLFNILLLLFLVYSMFAVVAVQAYGTTKYGYRTGPTANFDTWPMVSKRIPFQKKNLSSLSRRSCAVCQLVIDSGRPPDIILTSSVCIFACVVVLVAFAGDDDIVSTHYWR